MATTNKPTDQICMSEGFLLNLLWEVFKAGGQCESKSIPFLKTAFIIESKNFPFDLPEFEFRDE